MNHELNYKPTYEPNELMENLKVTTLGISLLENVDKNYCKYYYTFSQHPRKKRT